MLLTAPAPCPLLPQASWSYKQLGADSPGELGLGAVRPGQGLPQHQEAPQPQAMGMWGSACAERSRWTAAGCAQQPGYTVANWAPKP